MWGSMNYHTIGDRTWSTPLLPPQFINPYLGVEDGHVPDAPLRDAPLRVQLDAQEAALQFRM